MKKLSAVILILTLFFTLAGCGGSSNDSGSSTGSDSGTTEQTGTSTSKHIVLRVGNTTAPDSHYNKGLEYFKEKLDEYTNGQIELQIFHSSQLGNERDLVEGVGMGTVEMALVSTGPLPNYSADFMVFDLPFITDDREHLYSVMDGEVGQKILGTLEPKGIKALGFWENGFRHITNNEKPIIHPADVKGMKIRVMENPIHQETFKVLGAIPTPMAWSEVFTALQQGTIDGQENPMTIIGTAKVYEVQKYISLTGHFYSPCVLMINKDLFDGLSPDLQEAILKAEAESRVWQRNYAKELDESLIKELREAGIQIDEVDTAEWQEAVKSVYDTFANQINPEYLKALRGY